jgi:hypothetical protein
MAGGSCLLLTYSHEHAQLNMDKLTLYHSGFSLRCPIFPVLLYKKKRKQKWFIYRPMAFWSIRNEIFKILRRKYLKQWLWMFNKWLSITILQHCWLPLFYWPVTRSDCRPTFPQFKQEFNSAGKQICYFLDQTYAMIKNPENLRINRKKHNQ